MKELITRVTQWAVLLSSFQDNLRMDSTYVTTINHPLVVFHHRDEDCFPAVGTLYVDHANY